jgi:hypothetical protein
MIVLRPPIGGVGQRKPANLALAAFGPVLRLFAHRQRIDRDRRGHVARWTALQIAEGADVGRAGIARDPGLLERLARGRLVAGRARHRIALRDHPALAVARGDQQHLDPTVRADAIGQGANLLNAMLLKERDSRTNLAFS